jgi:dihydrofolate synthase/folylpolyglutamate synthase
MGTQIMVDSPLVGRHQLRNLALAIAAAEELHNQQSRNQGLAQITPSTIEQGIRDTKWPGRFQVLSRTTNNPEYVFDVAHNPAGAWALRSTLSAAYQNSEKARNLTLVFGVMRDKAMQEITEILFPVAERVIVTHANNPRSATPQEIRQAAGRIADSTNIEEAVDVVSAMARAREIAGIGGLIVVTGSIYIVGEAMRILGVRI